MQREFHLAYWYLFLYNEKGKERASEREEKTTRRELMTVRDVSSERFVNVKIENLKQ